MALIANYLAYSVCFCFFFCFLQQIAATFQNSYHLSSELLPSVRTIGQREWHHRSLEQLLSDLYLGWTSSNNVFSSGGHIKAVPYNIYTHRYLGLPIIIPAGSLQGSLSAVIQFLLLWYLQVRDTHISVSMCCWWHDRKSSTKSYKHPICAVDCYVLFLTRFLDFEFAAKIGHWLYCKWAAQWLRKIPSPTTHCNAQPRVIIYL